MYNDEAIRIPANEKELWEALWEQFEFVRHVLWDLEVETKEEALDNDYHERENGSVSRDGMGVIRYRDTGDHLDQRDHYLAMGRNLLPYIHQSLDERRLTPGFVQQWGKIMFCHGYIASYVFDDTDDLTPTRAGRKTGELRSKDTQRKWIAHIMIPLIDNGIKRELAQELAVQHVEAALRDEVLRGGFPESWFRPIIKHGELVATYDSKHFAVKAMRKLIDEPTDDIPPIPNPMMLLRVCSVHSS